MQLDASARGTDSEEPPYELLKREFFFQPRACERAAHCAPSMSSSHRAPRGAVRARKRVLRWDFLAQPAQCMHPADARSSAARRVVVLPAQVTLARGLESDPPVVPAMSSLVGLRRCTLAGIAIQAASGAASTCALPDSCVDIFSPVRHRFSHLQQARATSRSTTAGGSVAARCV